MASAATVIRWASGADTSVCAVNATGIGECEIAVGQIKNANLRAVVPVNLGLEHPAQWIEVRQSSYALCAFSSYRQTQCEVLDVPRLSGSKLRISKTKNGEAAFRLRFPRVYPKDARIAIGRAFAKSLTHKGVAIRTGLATGPASRTQFLLNG
jgi:hypothetical protein